MYLFFSATFKKKKTNECNSLTRRLFLLNIFSYATLVIFLFLDEYKKIYIYLYIFSVRLFNLKY